MREIVLVGTGPGPVSLLTREAEAALLGADRVLFRMSGHPVCHWLREQGRDVICFDALYALPGAAHAEIYDFIARAVVKESRRTGRAVYALPGNPFVFEATSRIIERLARAEGIAVRVIAGLSFLDLAYATLGLDPARGLQICNALDFGGADPPFTNRLGLLIGQLFARPDPAGAPAGSHVESVTRWLLARFSPAHPVSLVWLTGLPGYETLTRTCALADLPRECDAVRDSALAATLFVPPVP